MSDDAPVTGTRRRRWPRIAALLLLVALVGGAIVWLTRPSSATATALFEVRMDSPSILSKEPGQSRNESDYEILKKTQLALLKQKFVLKSALVNPGVASLSILASERDKEGWLQDHLKVEFPQNGEILSISLTGAPPEDLETLVNAVAEAYKKEVLAGEQQRKLNTRDLLNQSLQDLNKDIKRKYEDYLEIAKAMGRSDGSSDIQQQLDMRRLDRVEEELMQLEREQLKIETGGDAKEAKYVKQRIEQLHKRQAELEKTIVAHSATSVDLIVRKHELVQLQSIADEMSTKLEKLDIEAQSEYRIRQVQPAMIEPKQIAGGDIRQ